MHQLLVYADDINILCENTNAIKKTTGALLAVSEEVGLDVNTYNTKHMVESCHQNAGQNCNLLTNKSFENMTRVQTFEKNSNISKLQS
jgi:hypothetical protein